MPKKPRKPLEPEQIEDARRLRLLWDKRPEPQISQAKFAADNGLGDTQGIVWQYISGTIPLNLAAAIKFARGLRCRVQDFSPTLAAHLSPAQEVAGKELTPREELLVEYVLKLTHEQQGELLVPLRAAIEANDTSQKILKAKLRTIGNERMEKEYGLPSSGHRRPRGKRTPFAKADPRHPDRSQDDTEGTP